MDTDNHLIPLPGFELPTDFPWRIGYVALVNDQLRRLRSTGYFLPPRFFGYYFQGGKPMGVSGSWTVTLDLQQPVSFLPDMVDQATLDQFSIESDSRDRTPEYLLIHDRWRGACWLRSFLIGFRFVEAVDPVTDGEESTSDHTDSYL